MYNLNGADKLRRKKQEKDPNYDRKLLDRIKRSYPENYAHYIHEDEYGRHIGDRETYNEAIKNLYWKNGDGIGAKWDVDDLANKSKINFNEQEYDKYDYGYTVNRLHADNNNAFTDSDYYMQMAKNYLTDDYYNGRPSERAYEDMRNRTRMYIREMATRKDRDNDGRYNE